MKTPVLAVTLLALSASFASAEINSLSGKAMSDLPGTKGGFTAAPTAREFSVSLEDKVQMDHLGRNTGLTTIRFPARRCGICFRARNIELHYRNKTAAEFALCGR